MSQLSPRARPVLAATAGAIGGAVAWWRWPGPGFAALAILMGALLVLALLVPRAYAPVYRALDGFVRHALQAITWIVLGLVFALVFVPGRFGLALRRRDPLNRRPDPARTTYWHHVARPVKDTAAHFRRQF